MSAGLIIGAIAGLAITAASPAILGYCAARAIGRRLTT